MRAVVLGAGIAGITMAYELERDGHDVTVIEREAQPASCTSYANAGLFAPGHAYAWASPAAPGILLPSLWRNDQALRFKPSFDPRFWSWMWQFWRQCTTTRAEANTAIKARLCLYSLEVFHETLARAPISYDGRKGGLLYFHRSQAAFDAAARKADILRQAGCHIELLDRDGVARTDPALAPVKEQIAGALFARDDESGDCRLFARNMAAWLEARGVDYRFGTTVRGLATEGDAVSGVVTDTGIVAADFVVLCLGVYSPHLSRQVGQDLPIYPVKGYAITAPVAGRNNPPTRGGVDEQNLVAYAPYGDRIRVTATAEFSGFDCGHRATDFVHMLATMRKLFPHGADWSQAEYWAGLRPMTPQGTPILGRRRHKNLWYNTGLGHMGWTMSHGCARLVADLIGQRPPAIPLDGLGVP